MPFLFRRVETDHRIALFFVPCSRLLATRKSALIRLRALLRPAFELSYLKIPDIQTYVCKIYSHSMAGMVALVAMARLERLQLSMVSPTIMRTVLKMHSVLCDGIMTQGFSRRGETSTGAHRCDSLISTSTSKAVPWCRNKCEEGNAQCVGFTIALT